MSQLNANIYNECRNADQNAIDKTIDNWTLCTHHLHLHPYFVYATSEGSGESAHLCSLTRSFVVRQWTSWAHELVQIYHIDVDSRPMGCGFEPHQRHYVVSLSKTLTLILGSTQSDTSRHNWNIVDWDVKNEIKSNHTMLFYLRRKVHTIIYTIRHYVQLCDKHLYFDRFWVSCYLLHDTI